MGDCINTLRETLLETLYVLIKVLHEGDPLTPNVLESDEMFFQYLLIGFYIKCPFY